MSTIITILFSLFFLLPLSIYSQECPPLYTFTGEEDGDQFGIYVSSAGDVNNDGYDDFIVGALLNDAGGNDAGRAYVFSGQTGETIHVFTGEAAGDQLGWPVASAGDINGDSFDDLLVGAYLNDAGGIDRGRAYVFSGQTGDPIYVFTGEADDDRLGWAAAPIGDIDGDGFNDLIIGAPQNSAGGSNAGRAYVFSGQTGDTIYVFTGEAEWDLLGTAVASAGDVNNDGYEDFIISAYLYGSPSTGRAYVFSGQTGDTIHVFTGEATNDRFGWSVASAGDVNSDGFADLIIGARYYDAGGIDRGRVYVFSGKTGDTLYIFTGEADFDQFGWSVASAGDVNNDGIDDLIVGTWDNDAGGTEAGRAYVFSGLTGDTIHVFTGGPGSDWLGTSVASIGDHNNLGFDDLIIGAAGYDGGGNNRGQAYVYLLDTCCCFVRGDVAIPTDGIVLVNDLVFLVDYLFKGGEGPGCPVHGDCAEPLDGICLVNDLVWLVDYLFKGGPTPPAC